MEYNLLATTDKITMSKASSQLWMNLRAIGDPEPKVNKTRIRGIVQAQTSLDPVEAIYMLREHMESEPERYDSIYRIFPIVTVVETDITVIVAEVSRQAEKMLDSETFRVTLEKRNTDLRSLEVIEPVAEVIDNKVDLVDPDWVVLVEIMGKTTGVSVIRSDALLNIQKEVYALSTKSE